MRKNDWIHIANCKNFWVRPTKKKLVKGLWPNSLG